MRGDTTREKEPTAEGTTRVTGVHRETATIAVAQGRRIRRGCGVQEECDDEAKPLDMARWRGKEGTRRGRQVPSPERA
jgi:hypothetical protein